MNQLPKVWKTPEHDPKIARTISEELDLPLPIAAVLASRGISSSSDADRFLSPRLSDALDPFALPDMSSAVERIWQAIRNEEQIAVYGDYDADGIVSTAVLFRVLSRLGASVSCFLPGRMTEGYGFSLAGMQRCAGECSPSLIVTADCGSNDAETVKAAKALGADVVVTDHHETTGSGSAPLALVNPKVGSDRASMDLAGSGVAFKLCHALVKRGREEGVAAAAEVDLRDYIPWVAIGTVADVVPLVGENRALVRYGLDQLSRPESELSTKGEASAALLGLRALMSIGKIKGPVAAWHVAFVIAPRLNAAGRLGDATKALELFLTADSERAVEISRELDSVNNERRAIERRATREAASDIDSWFKPADDYGIVVGKKGWHQGVIGIVASRLCTIYSRPVVVIAFDDNGQGKGSCRSVSGFNVVEGLEQCEEFLDTFGGHACAAGVSLQVESLDPFREAFNRACRDKLADADLQQVQHVDAWLNLREADERLWCAASRLGPFGEGNRMPVWGARNVRVVGQPRVLKEEHLKMTLVDGTTQMDAIGFNMGRDPVPDGPIDIAFNLDMNSFRGFDKLQMKLKNLRPADGAPS